MSTRGMPVTRQMKESRRKQAAERQAAYDALTIEQKLAKLPPAPGAKRQRAKLEAALSAVKTNNKTATTTADLPKGKK